MADEKSTYICPETGIDLANVNIRGHLVGLWDGKIPASGTEARKRYDTLVKWAQEKGDELTDKTAEEIAAGKGA